MEYKNYQLGWAEKYGHYKKLYLLSEPDFNVLLWCNKY